MIAIGLIRLDGKATAFRSAYERKAVEDGGNARPTLRQLRLFCLSLSRSFSRDKRHLYLAVPDM